MANRFLGAGDETKNYLLAGFETLSDEGSKTGRGGAGFGGISLLEVLRAGGAAAAALLSLTSSASDIIGAGDTPDDPSRQER